MALSTQYFLSRNYIPHRIPTKARSDREARDLKIRDMLLEGLTTQVIALHFSISLATVYAVRNKFSVPIPVGRQGRRTAQSNARNQQIRELREQGVSLEEIAVNMGITRERVRQITGVVKFNLTCPVCDKPFTTRQANKTECCALHALNVSRYGIDKARQLHADYQNRILMKAQGLQYCCRCKQWKKQDEFYANNPKAGCCADCTKARTKAYYARLREKAKQCTSAS